MSGVDTIGDSALNSSNKSNYALQYALKTMQERCQQLQKRLANVEDENCSLRMKNCRDKSLLQNDSQRTEVEILRDSVAQLTKQRDQLAQNIKMVSQENKNLWLRLAKLTDVNNSLGNKLSKINDTLNQHKVDSPPANNHLIRSKTFTQHSPRRSEKKSDQPNPDYSLEEISLKIIDQFSQEKAELEEQCAQMAEIQSDIEIDVNSFGFTYTNFESSDDESITELKNHQEKLHQFKDILVLQQQKLRLVLERIQKCQGEKDSKCKNCFGNANVEEIERKISTPTERPVGPIPLSAERRPCPMCGKIFLATKQYEEFLKHVESHFTDDDDAVNENYEIVSYLGS